MIPAVVRRIAIHEIFLLLIQLLECTIPAAPCQKNLNANLWMRVVLMLHYSRVTRQCPKDEVKRMPSGPPSSTI